MKQFTISILAAAVLALPGCKKDDKDEPRTFPGSATPMGSGKAWSYVTTASDGSPSAVGITIEKTALMNLPNDSHGGSHSHDYEYRLPLPAERRLTPFDHVAINWNPAGHPPAMVYDKPHFDLHFYLMPESERLQIPAFESDSTGFKQYPSPEYLPASYFPIPGGQAKMGVHWADATSPELSQTAPQPFTQTFIYGSYNGAVTYYEPMATLQFLTTTSTYSRDIPQPARFSKDGYYPTRMTYADKGNSIDIRLHDFVFRKKS